MDEYQLFTFTAAFTENPGRTKCGTICEKSCINFLFRTQIANSLASTDYKTKQIAKISNIQGTIVAFFYSVTNSIKRLS